MSQLEPIAVVAGGQHGLITRSQLVSNGVSARRIRTLTGQGVLVRRHRGIYALAGAATSWEQRLMVAVLATGPSALAGCRSASGLWSFYRYRRRHLDVMVPSSVRVHSNGWTVHETMQLPSRDRTVLHGIPVTTPTRTLIDVGRYVHPVHLGKMVDDAVVRELTTYDELHRRFGELARRGRDGTANMRAVLELRPSGAPAPDSAFEDEVRHQLRDVGIEPQLHHRVECDGVGYVLDIAWPDHRVAVECDGFRFHRTEEQLRWDDERRNRLILAGWIVLHETWSRFRADRTRIVAESRRALRAHGADL